MRCGAGRGVLLGAHGVLDAFAHRNAGAGLAVSLQLENVSGVQRGTSTWASSSSSSTATKMVKHCEVFTGSAWLGPVEDGDEDVHCGAPGVDEGGVQFDEFPDGDGPVQVG